VLDDITSRNSFWTATTEAGAGNSWLDRLRTAPVLIIFFADQQAYLDRYAEPDKGWTDRDEARWPVPYWHIDTGMAALLILLGAVDAGLAACFFGVFPDRELAVRLAFGIPDRLVTVGVISLGHSAPDRRSPSLRRRRRPLSEVVSYNTL
jgi:nitroreductase